MNSTSHSLLRSVQAGPAAPGWGRWHAVYEPLVRVWLHRHRMLAADRDDVVQEVLAVVVRRLPEFRHNGRPGAFRAWLKAITIFCLRDHWKRLKAHPDRAAATAALDQWADPASAVGREWDAEHDRQLLKRLLALLEPEFTPATWAAFRGLAVDGRPAAEVAAELGLTANAVYIAKSRVLTRLRQEAAGLVDEPDG